ncbi:MAG: pyroglutamyl-peptidase I [Alphaproteobacteria bacterium]|nr:pyroglutamyl-peptidase I [Alphaproteobacteria bacterium]
MSQKRKVLLTGFGPFPGVPRNATSDLVPAIAAAAHRRYPETEIVDAVLPVTWTGGPGEARRLIGRHQPDIVVHFGVSDRAEGFVIETQAANSCLAAPDADGALPPLELLGSDTGADLFSTLPCQEICTRLCDLGLRVEASSDAGGYLCNAVLFNSLKCARENMRVGFVHVPTGLEEGCKGLSMADAVRGGLEIIAVCLEGS